MILIFFASSLTDTGLPEGPSDKSVHFAVYAVLAVLWLRALADGRAANVTPARTALAVLAATVYGFSDEAHQYFVPGRHAAWQDLAADAVGALAGAVLGLLVGRIRRQTSGRPA